MSGGINSLATIIKRLEAAASRIEDVSEEFDRQLHEFKGDTGPGPSTAPSAPPPATAAALPPPPPPPPPPQTAAPSAPSTETPKIVLAFDESVIDGKLKPFLELTRAFAGQSLIDQAALLEKEFADLRSLLHIAALCQKPVPKALEELLTPLQSDIEAITRLKEASRKDRDWFTHLSAVAEGATCIGWVAVPTPGPYINDIKDSTVFYGNRVIKEYKDKDPKHAEWVRSYIALLEQCRSYVLEYHTTGLTWNPKGVTLAQHQAAPPGASAAKPAAGGVAAVFADLNRGESVTQGLRKVDKSEMTHKNPALRAQGPVSPAAHTVPKKPTKPAKPQSLSGRRPAKFALEGSKWVIEYQENESGLVVEDVGIHQTVNLFGCKNSTVQIKGKVNAVTIVNCTKTSVLVDSVISTVAVTNSPSFALQITGTAPTIQLDSTDSGQIYLSTKCLDTELTTAKCSSINVSIPTAEEEEGLFEEHAVPEMLKTVIKDGKLVTTVVEHVG